VLRQLDDLLVPVRLGHVEQSWIEDRQNDGNVVADQRRNVLVAPERQHSLSHLATHALTSSVLSPQPTTTPEVFSSL